MKKHLFILWASILLFLPITAFADCVDVSRATSYYIQGAHDVILYFRLTPLAFVNVPWCNIYSDSTIQNTTAYLCDSDKIIIDGAACDIFSIKSSTTPR
jgi:hypothetical protein